MREKRHARMRTKQACLACMPLDLPWGQASTSCLWCRRHEETTELPRPSSLLGDGGPLVDEDSLAVGSDLHNTVKRDRTHSNVVVHVVAYVVYDSRRSEQHRRSTRSEQRRHVLLGSLVPVDVERARRTLVVQAVQVELVLRLVPHKTERASVLEVVVLHLKALRLLGRCSQLLSTALHSGSVSIGSISQVVEQLDGRLGDLLDELVLVRGRSLHLRHIDHIGERDPTGGRQQALDGLGLDDVKRGVALTQCAVCFGLGEHLFTPGYGLLLAVV